MAHKPTYLNDALYEYLINHSRHESVILQNLREVSEQHPLDEMRSMPEHAQFLALLAKLMRAKLVIEVGVYTGYTTLVMAQALSDEGRVIACDMNADYAQIGQPFWEQAEVASKIDLRIGQAESILSDLIDQENLAGMVDMIFIDADKPGYDVYYERSLQLLRPGGLIALDNTFFHGTVLNQSEQGDSVRAIRQVNQKINHDSRVDMCMLSIADGLTLALKK